MDFDRIIDRRGTLAAKWDKMEQNFGVSPDDGLAMWVADMDFASPTCIKDAVRALADHGVFGYLGVETPYHDAICWWMRHRHDWPVQPEWIFTTHGVVNGVALTLQTFTQPGDGVILFTPVYHAFARIIAAGGRHVVECPLVLRDDRYEMDFDAYDAQMTGTEKAVILCSPHNPGGRVWTGAELHALGAFCKRHDLILISDEIHHDLVMPGHEHLPMPKADPSIIDRLVMLTAPSKTFNIAGNHTGQVIIPDPALRTRFGATLSALGISPNMFGVHMTAAAYSRDGAAWLDALIPYLDANRVLFDQGMKDIPGLKSMPLQSTYLAWVDFAGTGMDAAEVNRRLTRCARIAASPGASFGSGGETFMRFNLGMPRVHVEQAVDRIRTAFKDLQ